MGRCSGNPQRAWIFQALTDVFQYEQTHNMMQVWTGKLSELQLPVQNPARTDRKTDGLNQSYSCLVAAKNNRAPFLSYFKLCASYRSHWWIQIGVRVRKRPIWVKFNDFFSRVTLQFDVWPWKTIGHLFYATSSFVHHFLAIGEFKLELQSGNAQFGSNSTIFRALWPWNLTDDLEKQ